MYPMEFILKIQYCNSQCEVLVLDLRRRAVMEDLRIRLKIRAIDGFVLSSEKVIFSVYLEGDFEVW